MIYQKHGEKKSHSTSAGAEIYSEDLIDELVRLILDQGDRLIERR
jgi:hypothetical protein